MANWHHRDKCCMTTDPPQTCVTRFQGGAAGRFCSPPLLSTQISGSGTCLAHCLAQELGVEQNRNQNFEQKPKLVSVQSGYRNYRHTGYNFQEESRKNVLLLSLSPFTFWMNVQEEYILPAFFLKVVAGMPVFPVSWLNRNQFWFLLKVSVSVLFNP